ncbi:glycoside hydrolase family 3 N-terminal domain-containing protein [Pendulispora albinea]|uniref:Glycoside hydrolase family 3 N-terminal domain-containing protein n=1 Tax=Pendulispora albinea TaxID=2741071 RepID=A0ABZ2LRZ3_9BACT
MFRSFALPFVVVATICTSCSSSNPEASSVPDPASSAESALDALTPAQRAGQRIIYSYPGFTPPKALFDRIRAGEAAGVHFWSANVESPEQIRAVIAELVKAQKESPIHLPLLFITDQEGGAVRGLPGEPVISAKKIGESPDAARLAWKAGHDAAENLDGVGMNVNLAPVLDVFREPGNFIDKPERSYSQDPNVVRLLASRFIVANQRVGIASSVKHFPGLGSARVDQNTDEAPVTLDVPLSTLRRVDEAPYTGAIAAGVKLVMPSWATYPSLDPNRPAGLSPLVMRDELRGRLGFKGVTISETMIAGALNPFGNVGQRSVLAAKAGLDLILCSFGDVSQGDEAREALANALQNGELDKADFNTAVRRITALRYGLSR